MGMAETFECPQCPTMQLSTTTIKSARVDGKMGYMMARHLTPLGATLRQEA